MKRFALTLACLSAAILFGTSLSAQKYEYPFQNPDLSEEERVENLLSLMTLEEKIATFSGLGVPRLGVPDPGRSEAYCFHSFIFFIYYFLHIFAQALRK